MLRPSFRRDSDCETTKSQVCFLRHNLSHGRHICSVLPTDKFLHLTEQSETDTLVDLMLRLRTLWKPERLPDAACTLMDSRDQSLLRKSPLADQCRAGPLV